MEEDPITLLLWLFAGFGDNQTHTHAARVKANETSQNLKLKTENSHIQTHALHSQHMFATLTKTRFQLGLRYD